MGAYRGGRNDIPQGVLNGTSGQWIPIFDGNNISAATTLDQFKISPLDISETLTIDELAVEITVIGAAGAVLRGGIYRDNGTWVQPGELIYDTGTIPADATIGVKEFALPDLVLVPGRYWFGVVSQIAICTVRGTTSTPVRVPLTTAAAFATQVMYRSFGGASGALPDPAPDPAAGGSSVTPSLAIRLA